jgi:hypothetical protein
MKFEKWNPFKKSEKSIVEITKDNVFAKNKTIKLRMGIFKLKAIVFQTDKYVISVRCISNDSLIKVFDKNTGNNTENIKIEKELFDNLWNHCIKAGFKVEKILSDTNSIVGKSYKSKK